MKTFLLIWSLVLGHCLAVLFDKVDDYMATAGDDPGFPDAKLAELGLAVYSPPLN